MGKSARTMFLVVGLLLTVLRHVRASDPEVTTDIGINPTSVDNFTFTGFRNIPANEKGVRTQSFSSFQNTPGLTGLAMTTVQFMFGPESQTDPHIHPRANEVFYVLEGSLDVGFVDTYNRLWETTLQKSDLFVFPKGQLHWQRNNGDGPASGLSFLTSQNPGTMVVSNACFNAGGKGLPDNVLQTAFGADIQTIESMKKAVAALQSF
ncbi:unnamed protein product [Calypogeia fissa]